MQVQPLQGRKSDIEGGGRKRITRRSDGDEIRQQREEEGHHGRGGGSKAGERRRSDEVEEEVGGRTSGPAPPFWSGGGVDADVVLTKEAGAALVMRYEKKLMCAPCATGKVGYSKNQLINMYLNADAPTENGGVLGAEQLERVQDAILAEFTKAKMKPIGLPVFEEPKVIANGGAAVQTQADVGKMVLETLAGLMKQAGGGMGLPGLAGLGGGLPAGTAGTVPGGPSPARKKPKKRMQTPKKPGGAGIFSGSMPPGPAGPAAPAAAPSFGPVFGAGSAGSGLAPNGNLFATAGGGPVFGSQSGGIFGGAGAAGTGTLASSLFAEDQEEEEDDGDEEEDEEEETEEPRNAALKAVQEMQLALEKEVTKQFELNPPKGKTSLVRFDKEKALENYPHDLMGPGMGNPLNGFSEQVNFDMGKAPKNPEVYYDLCGNLFPKEDYEVAATKIPSIVQVNHEMGSPSERMRLALLTFGVSFNGKARMKMLGVTNLLLAARRDRLAKLVEATAGGGVSPPMG